MSFSEGWKQSVYISGDIVQKPGEEIWHFGLETRYFAEQEGYIEIENLYQVFNCEEKIEVDGENKEPWELLAEYVKGCLTFLGVHDPVQKISALMITVPQITGGLVRNLKKAYAKLGFSPKRSFLQDNAESYYYYVMNQRPDYGNRKVGWFTFDQDRVSFAKMVMDTRKKPCLVEIEKGKTIGLSVDPMQRDMEFYQLIHESCGNDNYASIYMVGEGFEKEWAVRSVPLLCKNQRHVYYGNNLFVKGACYGAKEKVEERVLKGYQYIGADLIRKNVSMEMQTVAGKIYYPVVEAGYNWYEMEKDFELILDGKTNLEFLVSPMEGGIKSRVGMSLPGLPNRPNRTTRLHVHISYESAQICVITVEDMGFGEMFLSSRMSWTEKVTW